MGVKNHLMRLPGELLARCLRLLAWLHQLLQHPPDTQVRAGEELDIPLRTLPLARVLGMGAAASMLACSMHLLVWGQWALAAALIAVAATAAVIMQRDLWLRGRAGPVRLQLATDGQFRIYCRDGRVDPVRLRPQSLRVGSGVLLVLCGTRTYRLWLAQGNVRPEVLAALHRRLGRGPTGVPGLR